MNKEIIVDHDGPVILNPEKIELFNFQAIQTLPFGLYSLATSLREKELINMEEFNQKKVTYFTPKDRDDLVISCYFHWFSVSLVNFLRAVGLIKYLNLNEMKLKDIDSKKVKSDIKNYCSNFVSDIVPEIKYWRDKVAAHFAATFPYESDDQAMLEYSIMNLINFDSPYYKAGFLNWGVGEFSTDFKPWSLTKAYEDLGERFWPNLNIKSINNQSKRKD